MARSMMKGKDLPKSFWAKACNTVVYILNHSYTKAVKGMTPLQAYSGKKPSAAHFKIFGCECFVHVPDANRTKWDPKSNKCIFLGYSEGEKGYHLYNHVTKKVIVSRDVVFNERPNQLEEQASFPDNQDEDVHLVHPPTADRHPPTVFGRK